jgi:hypothetical protein
MVTASSPIVEIQEKKASVEQQSSESGWINAQATARASRAAKARNSSGRRRFVDPTTCEREYDIDEMEFLKAIEDYKKSSGRSFPTWSEVLEVVKSLGYVKVG